MRGKPPEISGILETSLYVENLEISRRFYTTVFSFHTIYEDPRMCALSVGESHVLLLFKKASTLEPVHTPGGIIPPHDGSGKLHLTFAVKHSLFPAWREWLVQQGIPIESTVQWSDDEASLYIRDPDGHLIEIATPGLWKQE